MEEEIRLIKKEAKEKLQQISDQKELLKFKIEFLGRKGKLTHLLRKIKDLPKEKRPSLGRLANQTKEYLDHLIKLKEKEIRFKKQEEEIFDVTLDGYKIPQGHKHPLSLFLEKVIEVFRSMNFEVVEGPEVETEKYNFDLLNIPPEHPARDVWDTFYVKSPSSKSSFHLVLRTHTSPVQLRAMEKRRPPVRIIVPGRVFRHEATDASHETTFYQCEGLVIDKGITVANLIWTLKTFLKAIFGENIKIRVRPHFYPFVEPGMDIDMGCLLCKGKGCSACGQKGYLEMLGSGLVHPQVLKNMNIDPKKYSGFAFGMGIDRLAMLYYGINDIRLSYSSDLRFLNQF